MTTALTRVWGRERWDWLIAVTFPFPLNTAPTSIRVVQMAARFALVAMLARDQVMEKGHTAT